jgi:hypothetical protein
MEKNQAKMKNSEEEHVWRFSLGQPPSPCRHDDPLVEMVRAFFADFFNIGYFTSKGIKVDVEGFALTNDFKTVYEIFRDNK